MLIGSRQRIADKTLNISVGGTVLNRATSVWYLGVIIDPTLSWSSHIFNVVSRVRSRLSSIIRYGSLPPVQVFRSLHRQCPSYLRNMFQYSKDVTGHLSRNINCLYVPRVSTNFGKVSFLPWDSFMEQFTIQCCRGCYTVFIQKIVF